MDQDQMSNLYRGPSIDATYQISVHLGKRFQRRRFFRNQPIKNNGMWRPCLLTDRDKMSNLYRGPSIDASYQVSLPLAEGFQRRRLKCEKITDDRRRTTDAKWWQKLTLPLARWAKNGQSGETSNIRYTRRKKNTTQYALNTTIHKQTQIT
jgi:hypothetical protein